MTTTELPLDAIEVPFNRLREADPAKVQELAASLTEIGQIQAIEVIPVGAAGRFRLNVGLHRFLAAQSLGWTRIEATVFEGSAAVARLREIDENLFRAELTPYDQAALLAERRQIFEALYGPVRCGRPAKGVPDSRSFYDEIGDTFGLPRTTVKRALKRWYRISRDVWPHLRGTSIARNGLHLDALTNMEPKQQADVVRRVLQGQPAAEAIAAAKSDDRELSPSLRPLIAAWMRADPAARAAFLDWIDANPLERETC